VRQNPENQSADHVGVLTREIDTLRVWYVEYGGLSSCKNYSDRRRAAAHLCAASRISAFGLRAQISGLGFHLEIDTVGIAEIVRKVNGMTSGFGEKMRWDHRA
jgi:hypothetical protein